jgi:pectin methylesterase-like acyl-CoA thioesterase
MEGIEMHATTRPTDSLSIQHSDEARRPGRVVRALTLLVVVGAAISAFFLLTEIGSANTLVVGSGGYATIGAAVQAASSGDTVLVHAGTYGEEVNLSGKAVTVKPYGDGPVTVDGECQRDHAVYIGSGSGMVVQGFTVKRTIAASIFIERASNVTIDGMTIQDFACQGHDDVWRAGIASWYSGSNITVTNNTIQFRTSGSPYSRNDGI